MSQHPHDAAHDRREHPPHDGAYPGENTERRARRGAPDTRSEGRRGRHGGGGRRRFEEAEPVSVSADAVTAWLVGRLPDDWFTGAPQITVDRDEITVVGTLTAPQTPKGADAPAVTEAEEGRITRFREDTREQRMTVAREAEHRYGRQVSWGAQTGETRQLFTTLSVPVMTRLRQPERHVLDTLVDSSVARSRSDALAWCVRLVGRNSDEWLGQLREAMTAVEKVRQQGPGS